MNAGLYGGGKELEIVEIDDCLLQDETANRILAITKRELPKIQAKVLWLLLLIDHITSLM